MAQNQKTASTTRQRCPIAMERQFRRHHSNVTAMMCFALLSPLWIEAGAIAAITQESDQNVWEVSDEDLLMQEVPSVFAASKYEQKTTEAPAAISIITADEIQRFGYRTLDDVLRAARGFYVTYDRAYSYYGVRGFGQPGDYNSRLLLLVDGHRINDAIYDTAYGGIEGPLSLEDVVRIEIVRGPASALYGPNAFFGVINIITKRGRDLQGIAVDVSAASYNTYQGHLAWGKRLAHGVELYLSGTFMDSRGQDLYFPEYDSAESNNGITQNSDAARMYRLRHNFSFHDLTFQGLMVWRSKQLPNTAWGTRFNDPRSSIIDRRTFLELAYTKNLNNQFSIDARVFVDDYLYLGDYSFDYSEDDNPYIVINKDVASALGYGAEFRVNAQLARHHRLTGGIEFVHNPVLLQQNFDEEVYLDDKRSSALFGAFVQDAFRIADFASLHAGFRFDYYTMAGFSANPRVALLVTPWSGLTVKAIYGTAYRPPNIYELYYWDGGSTTKQSTNLQSERITMNELSVEYTPVSKVRLEASAFHYDVRDLINVSIDQSDGLLVFDNLANADALGFELQAEWNPVEGLRTQTSYTYQRAQETTSSRWLANSPQHLLKFGVLAPLLKDYLLLGIEAQAMSKRASAQRSVVDGHVLVNVSLLSRDVLPGLTLGASVYNVFDEQYMDPVSEEIPMAAITQNGRNFAIRMGYEF